MGREEAGGFGVKMFLVWADEHDYDEYDSFVVAANSPVEAMKLAHELPCSEMEMNVEYIGEAFKNEACIILGSFNAG
jgi:hypothetical protein